MRVFHVMRRAPTFVEPVRAALSGCPTGYLWTHGAARREFEVNVAMLQTGLAHGPAAPLVDLHVSDLLNNQLPSHFDDTSWYDLLVFRRLATAAPFRRHRPAPSRRGARHERPAPCSARRHRHQPGRLRGVRPRAAHRAPADCLVRDYFAARLAQHGPVGRGLRGGSPCPQPGRPDAAHGQPHGRQLPRAACLLTRQFAACSRAAPAPAAVSTTGSCCWVAQRAAPAGRHLRRPAQRHRRMDRRARRVARPRERRRRRERELLRVRSRDVLEHIERVLTHVRRLESSADGGGCRCIFRRRATAPTTSCAR